MPTGDEGAGWQWAGLSLSWPSSFEPDYSHGLRNIRAKYMRLTQEAEAQNHDTSRLAADQARAEQQWKATVKVSKTLRVLNGRARR